MTLVRRLARPMLAAVFVSAGLDAVRAPGPREPGVEEVAAPVAAKLPFVPEEDTEQLVKINGAVQVVAGSLLAMGRLPRLSALALAVTLVPTTLAGHRFWETSGAEKADQQFHFTKNVGLLGGLLLAAVDTEGKPGLAWRARAASRAAGREARGVRRAARRQLPG